MGRSWRTFATSLSFVVFGLGALLMSALLLSAIAASSGDKIARRRRARACIGASFRLFLRFIEILGLVRFEIDATLKALADEGGSIIVANHPTLLDVVVLLAHLEQSNCVVKRALWRNPILSWPIRAAGYIPNDDPETLISASEDALRRHETLIIFPEATRTRTGQPVRLQRGAANIALRTGAPLRVVHIACEPALLTKGNPWYHVPARQPCFAMKVGVSVRARDVLGRKGIRGIAVRHLTRILQSELSKEIWRDERAGARAEATPH
jgi:1-acyl-sn-glycerol-3-phosphate acyltransferase